MNQTKHRVFYSFHYKDVMRVMQVRNIGALEDNRPVHPNAWETIRRKGDAAVKEWIDGEMERRSAIIVLIGAETSTRPLVRYEIQKAWENKMGLVGIHIHNLKDPNTGTCNPGKNPLKDIIVSARKKRGGSVLEGRGGFLPERRISLSEIAVVASNPGSGVSPVDAIKTKMAKWVKMAIELRREYA